MDFAPYVADCWFLTGPTAAGKTGVGLELARRLDGEILSLDSMALFRRMDIGTAKPTVAERSAIPHHLVDILDPAQDFSLAEYVATARGCTADILARKKVPIFVGGTPLYLKALLRGIFSGPPADWQFRERMEQEAASRGPTWLHDQVCAVDPVSGAKLHPQDTKRLIRALEVFELTGTRISDLQQQFDQSRPQQSCRVFVLDWPREELYRRINTRVDAMFAAGLVAEVQSLVGDDPRSAALSRTARQALGYREVIEHLAGEHSLAATIEFVQNRTRAFARRQLTWFRSLSECRWISCTPPLDVAAVANEILSQGNSGESRT